MNGDTTDAPPAPEQNEIAKEPDGDERENKEVEEEQDKGCDQIDDLKKQQEGKEDAGDSKPKLAEGFYEIEAVRRKRVRKGQVQYFIKWRGWPETANTWEPYENLAACYDVIEAFEESLLSGKHKSRKRKRKSTGLVPQAKKKPQGNAASTSRAPDAGNVKFDEGNFVVPSLDDQNHEDGDRSRMGDINNNEAVEQGNENSSVVFPTLVEVRENHNEMNATLVESTDALFPSEGRNRLPVVDILESEASDVICVANGHQNAGGEGLAQVGGLENGHHRVGGEGLVQGGGLGEGHQMVDAEQVAQADGVENGHQAEEVVQGDSFENGHQMLDGEGVMQAVARLGSRKRKPALVKRFNQTQAPCVINYATPDLTTENKRSGVVVVQNRDQNAVNRSKDLGCKSKSDDITDVSSITEIMKPISFTSSESAPDILVTFMAKRSDGKEVMVDNKYLKANNPLLLINYYEQHLNYNTATGPPRPGRDSTL
ncbi:Chromo domain-containing protein [Heracleum sosnowskyi]|uniref:Chromo domain-containing protein n=1 Tax=Heracleum sosnowskyi TaxID=360622 RepID=A0AAD8HE72_9APIA|nr:Chromo domain-containing protein [Heracleum sosnowskyi]